MRFYLERVNGGLVVFDGGTGMSFQDAGLTTDDFGGPEFDGCMEILNVPRFTERAERYMQAFGGNL